jgi:hypothetical protein
MTRMTKPFLAGNRLAYAEAIAAFRGALASALENLQ